MTGSTQMASDKDDDRNKPPGPIHTNESAEVPSHSDTKDDNSNVNSTILQKVSSLSVLNNSNNINTASPTNIISSNKVKLPNFNDVFNQSTTRPSSPLQQVLASKSLTPQHYDRSQSPTQINYPYANKQQQQPPLYPMQLQQLKPSPQMENQRANSPVYSLNPPHDPHMYQQQPTAQSQQQQQQQQIYQPHFSQQYQYASPNDGIGANVGPASNSPNLSPANSSQNSFKSQFIERPSSRLRFQSDPTLHSPPSNSSNSSTTINTLSSGASSSTQATSNSGSHTLQQQQQYTTQGSLTPLAARSPSLTPTVGSPSLIPHHSYPMTSSTSAGSVVSKGQTSHPAHRQQQNVQQQQQQHHHHHQQHHQQQQQQPPPPPQQQQPIASSSQVIHYHTQPVPLPNQVPIQMVNVNQPHTSYSYPPSDAYFDPHHQTPQPRQVQYYQNSASPPYPPAQSYIISNQVPPQQHYLPNHSVVAPVHPGISHPHPSQMHLHPQQQHYPQYQNVQIYPVKTASAWSPEDDKLLRILKEDRKLGWREISSYFPTRTLNACQFRWRRIVVGVVGDNKNKSSTGNKSGNNSRSNSTDNHHHHHHHRAPSSSSSDSLSDLSVKKGEGDEDEETEDVTNDGDVHAHAEIDESSTDNRLLKSRKLSEEESTSPTSRVPIYHELSDEHRHDEKSEEEEVKRSLLLTKNHSEESVHESDVPAQKSKKRSLDDLLN